VVIHHEEALYQVYAPLPLPSCTGSFNFFISFFPSAVCLSMDFGRIIPVYLSDCFQSCLRTALRNAQYLGEM